MNNISGLGFTSTHFLTNGQRSVERNEDGSVTIDRSKTHTGDNASKSVDQTRTLSPEGISRNRVAQKERVDGSTVQREATVNRDADGAQRTVTYSGSNGNSIQIESTIVDGNVSRSVQFTGADGSEGYKEYTGPVNDEQIPELYITSDTIDTRTDLQSIDLEI